MANSPRPSAAQAGRDRAVGAPSTFRADGAKMQRMLVRYRPQERILVRFLFRDDLSARRLDEVRDPALLDSIAPVRSFVDSALAELSHEDLDVIFWEDEDGMLKMTLQGADDVVGKAKALIGDRAAVPPAQH